MRLTASLESPTTIAASWVAIPLFEGEPIPADFPSASLIASLVESKDITGSLGETTALFGAAAEGGSFLVYGLGKKSVFSAGAAFSAGVAISKRLSGKKRSTVAVSVPPGGSAIISALTEGLVVGTVGPGIRKSEPCRHPFESLTLVDNSSDALGSEAVEQAGRRGIIVGDAMNLARDLTNTPPSEKPPEVFAQLAADIAKNLGIDVEVWDLPRLKAERFHGVIAVSRGSAAEPRFVRLEYRRGGDSECIALVGKGVTFDSGGLSLKPSTSMEDMKCDMTGAAVVLATFQAVSKLEIPVNLDGYFALTENMTGGAAMKLGDVITMRNGLTVEVLNTDAEGRLILADVLSYAAERKPAKMVDLATLTGACMVALGNQIAGLFSNDEQLAGEILSASDASGERTWKMPLHDDFGELIKSKVAEIKNVGGKWGGAITAAKFLQRFVGDIPWAHLDIAGPAWADSESSIRDAGGTGCFVRTLIALLEGQVKIEAEHTQAG
ncbi:MAG: leucyl aminopeptidase [Planctomycetota bacterium]|nr:leucyl aminopeptidase [Planctomycetota bacterium]